MAQYRQMIATASVLQKRGWNDEAIKFYQRELAGRKEVPEHLDTLTSMHDLANFLQGQDKLEDAEQLAQQALAGRRKVLGLEHEDTNASAKILEKVRRQVEDRKKKSQKGDKQKKSELAKSPLPEAPSEGKQEQGQHMKPVETESPASPEQDQEKEPRVTQLPDPQEPGKPPKASVATQSPVPSGRMLQERDRIKVTEVTPSPARGLPSRKPQKPMVRWLEDKNMLQQEIPNAKIMQFYYPSTKKDLGGPNQTLELIAKALHDQLQEEGRPVKPVVFIGHGFGGIVVEKTLAMNPPIPTAGILFLGTPIWDSTGTPICDSTAGTRLAKYAGNATTKFPLEKLCPDKFQDDLLGSLLPEFNKIVKDRKILLESYSNWQAMFKELYGGSHQFAKVCVALTEFGRWRERDCGSTDWLIIR
jgi:Tetratricopeptide repeat